VVLARVEIGVLHDVEGQVHRRIRLRIEELGQGRFGFGPFAQHHHEPGAQFVPSILSGLHEDRPGAPAKELAGFQIEQPLFLEPGQVQDAIPDRHAAKEQLVAKVIDAIGQVIERKIRLGGVRARHPALHQGHWSSSSALTSPCFGRSLS
jgi:hypothetical protein